MLATRRNAQALVLFLVPLLARPVLGQDVPQGPAPIGTTSGSTSSSPPPKGSGSSTTNSRVLAGVILGAAAVAIGVGAALAIANDKRIGDAGVNEPDTVPIGLGIGFSGLVLGMIGTMLWFNAPKTGTQVVILPDRLVFARSF